MIDFRMDTGNTYAAATTCEVLDFWRLNVKVVIMYEYVCDNVYTVSQSWVIMNRYRLNIHHIYSKALGLKLA